MNGPPKMVNAKDWLVFRLTGRLFTEPSDASGTGMLDLDQLACLVKSSK